MAFPMYSDDEYYFYRLFPVLQRSVRGDWTVVFVTPENVLKPPAAAAVLRTLARPTACRVSSHCSRTLSPTT